MARLEFYASATRVASGIALAAGATYVVYSDSAGTVLADISATAGGSAISGSTKASDANGVLNFWGPPTGVNTLYLRCPALPIGVQRIDALADPRIEAVEARVGRLFPADPAAWFAADEITGLADGAAVATWPDSSGNGRDLTQAAAGSKPSYQTNERNGLPVVRFDGNSDQMAMAAVSAVAQPVTVFVVASANDTAATGYLFDSQDGSQRLAVYKLGDDEVQMYAGSAVSAGVQTYPMAAVVTATFNGVSSTLRKNGAQIATGDAGAGSFLGLRVGSRFTGGSDFFNGDVCELLVYTRTLSTVEVQQAEQYLGDKWGLAAGRYESKLTVADRGQWVSTTGSDSSDGLSGGSAKLTVQAALNALGTTGGVVNVLGGTYNHTAELSILAGDAPVTLRGMGTGIDASATRLVWATDLGSGKFAVKNSVDNATQKICLEDLLLEGPTPSGLPYGGAGSAVMRGVRLNRRMEARDCRIRGFHSGVNIVQDHNRLERCEISGNNYGVYWSDMPTYGDHLIYDCNLSGNWTASLAVAPTGIVLGTVVFRGHLGFGPYSILLEDDRDPGSACLGTVLFYDVSFEYAGNGHIISLDQTAKLENVVFESSGTWSMADEYAISGQDAPAIIQAGVLSTSRFYNAFPRPGQRVPTLAGIVVNTIETNTFDGSFLAAFTDYVAEGVPLFQAKLAINNVWRDATSHGFITKAQTGSAGVGAGQVVGWGTAADRDYVVPYSAAWTASADALVAGVALTTGPAANESVSQNCVVVAAEGAEVLALTTAATPSAGTYLMVDPADRDKVTASDGRLDLPLLGSASGSQSGTVSGTNCLINLYPPRPSGVRRKTVTGSRGGNAALADLLSELAALGIITDSSSA